MAGKTDSVSIRVSYRNLKDTKVEMMGMDDEPHHRIDLNSSRPSPSPSSSSSARVPNGNGDLPPPQSLPVPNQNTLMTLILSCTVAAGVQFGWALQLSLLTPYIQGRRGRLGGDQIRFKQREKGRKPTHKQIHTCSL